MQIALRRAIAGRDRAATAAIRSALAAIDNAGAIAVSPGPASAAGPHVAGAAAGLGAAERARRPLSEPEVAAIVAAEITDRLAAATDYDRRGRPDRAQRLRAEAAALADLAGSAAAGSG